MMQRESLDVFLEGLVLEGAVTARGDSAELLAGLLTVTMVGRDSASVKEVVVWYSSHDASCGEECWSEFHGIIGVVARKAAWMAGESHWASDTARF
jgi:hypothetical protein